jgi:hypothetical protein
MMHCNNVVVFALFQIPSVYQSHCMYLLKYLTLRFMQPEVTFVCYLERLSWWRLSVKCCTSTFLRRVVLPVVRMGGGGIGVDMPLRLRRETESGHPRDIAKGATSTSVRDMKYGAYEAARGICNY